MSSVTTSWHYASSVDDASSSYATGKYYRAWSSLSNIKKLDGVATCKSLTGKNGTYPRPSYIVAKNFGFNIPNYADITQVEVQIAHKKITHSSETAYPSIGKPSVGLYNVSDDGASLSAPTKTLTPTKATFSIKPTVASVNNSAFGVKLTYPANTNTNPGDLQLKYIAVRVTYNVPRFSLAVARADTTEKVVNDTIDLNLTINNLDKTSYSPSVAISLTSGATFNSLVSGSGSVTNSSSGIVWKPVLSKSVASATCKIRLNLTSEGSKTVSLSTLIPSRTDPTATAVNYTASTSFNVSRQSIEVVDPTPQSDPTSQTAVTLDLPNRMKVGDMEDLEIKFKSNVAFNNTDTFVVKISENDIVNESNTTSNGTTNGGENVISNVRMDHGSYINTGNIYTITPNVNNSTASDSFYFTLKALTQGKITITVLYQGTIISSKTINVILNSSLAYNYVEMTGEQLNRMGDGVEYTATTFIKINVTDASNLSDLGGNFRFGVFNSEIPSGSTIESYIFDNAKWSDMPSEFNEWCEESVKFNYQTDCPVYFIWTSDYVIEGYDDVTVDFTNPCVIESDEMDKVELVGLFPIPIKQIINTETVSQLSLDPGETTNKLRCYDFDCENLNDENIIIQGVELDMDVTNLNGECTVSAELISPTIEDGKNRYGARSIVLIDSENPHIHMGGEFDLWGLKFNDFENFSQFKLDLKIINYYNGAQSVEFNNLVLTVHYIIIEDSIIKCFVNGEDTRFYGMFIQKVEIPMGVETDTQYMEISGTDTTNAYRMNIDKKEIKIEFRVQGCTIEETTKYMERIAKLFTNPRDTLNRPTLNTLEFSHIPNRYWKVLMENSIDCDVEFVDYEGTIKLVVPDGTSYNTECTTTSYVGINPGIAKVNPLISIKPLQSKITILEENTKQKFIINESDAGISDFSFNEEDTIIIDCEDRKVYYYPLNKEDATESSLIEDEDKHLDITSAVNFNSDWFVIYGDYQFTSDDCDILFVQFFERW